MTWLKGFFAGVIGAAVMAAILAGAIAAGFKVLDFSLMWGTIAGFPVGATAWVVGFIIHLLVGGIFAVIYTGIFKAMSGAGWVRGAVIGLAHAVITGMCIALVPLVSTAFDRGRVANPGPYFSSHGLAGILFYFGIHLIYGAVVGGLYARMVRSSMMEVPETVDHDTRLVA